MEKALENRIRELALRLESRPPVQFPPSDGLPGEPGGVLIQPLPGCEEETLQKLEVRSMLFGDVSAQLLQQPLEEFFSDCFKGLDPQLLEVEGLCYTCDCSRSRMEKALISIGRRDLQEIIDDGKGTELVCNFCHEKHQFSTEELRALLEAARPETPAE